MRTAFLVLVLANVGFFAWASYLSPADPGIDPKPMSRQIEPGQLRLLPSATDAGRTAPVPGMPPSPAAESVPAGTVPATAAARNEPIACLEWGSLPVAEVGAAERTLAPLALGERLSRRQVSESAGWWVYMPPQGSRANAQKKAGELRGLGVTDYFIVQDEGENRWAISLGVFRTEESARTHLEALQAKKVRSAVLGPRPTIVPKVWLQVRAVDAELHERLKAAAQSLPGTELRPCESPG